jgi:hypothetical protein
MSGPWTECAMGRYKNGKLGCENIYWIEVVWNS